MMRTFSTIAAATAVLLPSAGLTGAMARPQGLLGKKGDFQKGDFKKGDFKKGDFNKGPGLDKLQKLGEKGDFKGEKGDFKGLSLTDLRERMQGKKPPMGKKPPTMMGRPAPKGGFKDLAALKGGKPLAKKGPHDHLGCVIKAVCADDAACVNEIKAEAEKCKAVTDKAEHKACHEKVKADIEARAKAKGIDTEELKKKCAPHHGHHGKGPHHNLGCFIKAICADDETCVSAIKAEAEKCKAVTDDAEKKACHEKVKADIEARAKAKGIDTEELKKKCAPHHGKGPHHNLGCVIKAVCADDEACATAIKAEAEKCKAITDETESKACHEKVKADIEARAEAKGINTEELKKKCAPHHGKGPHHNLGCVIKAVCADDEACATAIKAEAEKCKAIPDETENKACHEKVKADIEARAEAKGINTGELKKKCAPHHGKGPHGKKGDHPLAFALKALCVEDETCATELKTAFENCKAMTDKAEHKACHDAVKADIEARLAAKGVSMEDLKKRAHEGMKGKMGSHGKHGKKGPHHDKLAPLFAVKAICGADEACATELKQVHEDCKSRSTEEEHDTCQAALKTRIEARLEAKGTSLDELKKGPHHKHGKIPEKLAASALKVLCAKDEKCASKVKAEGDKCQNATDLSEKKACIETLKKDVDTRLKAKGLSLKQAEAMAFVAQKDLRGRDRKPMQKVKQTKIAMKTTAAVRLAASATADFAKDESLHTVVKSAIATSLSSDDVTVVAGDVEILSMNLKNAIPVASETSAASDAAAKLQGSLLTSNLRKLNTEGTVSTEAEDAETKATTEPKLAESPIQTPPVAQELEVDYQVTTEQVCDATGAKCEEDKKKAAIENKLKDEKALAKNLETKLQTAVAASPSVSSKMAVEGVSSASVGKRETVTVDVEVCVAGEFSMNYSCYPCPLGTFSSATGVSVNTCTACGEGLSTREVGSTVADQCTAHAELHLNSGAFAQNSALVLISFVAALLPVVAGFF